jgi:hypothetical protein
MTTFVSRVEILLNRLGQARSQQQDANARLTVERVRARVNSTGEKLMAISAAEPALRELGVVVDEIPASVQSTAAKARRTLRSTASAVTGAVATETSARVGTESVDEALRSADKIANDLLVKLNRAVNRRREAHLPSDLDEDIVTYPGVNGSLVVRLESVQRRLRASVEKVDAQNLEKHLQDIFGDIEIWRRDRPLLDEALENHHPEVKEFLRQAVTEEGARWDLITPTVREWLGNAGNTAGLRVVLRS